MMMILRLLQRTLAFGCLLSTLSMPAAAGIFDDDEARNAILDLREKVNKFQATTVDRFEKNDRALLDLQNQLAQLKQENASLRGQNELMRNELGQLQQSLQSYYQDLSERLKKLEPKQVEVDGQQGMVLPSETADYNAALRLFQNNDIKNALLAFQNFSQRYPQSIYLPLAQFWMGNIFYAQRNYKDALATLSNMIKDFPQHVKVPDAWSIIASCQVEKGQKQQARKTFNNIIAQYPQSEAATLAKQRLKDLR
jgi:tol-pal system protein YbgF